MIKSQLQKSDESLIQCYKTLTCERVKIGQDKETLSYRRFTKMLANLIMKNKEIQEIIINAEVKDDRWGKNGE